MYAVVLVLVDFGFLVTFYFQCPYRFRAIKQQFGLMPSFWKYRMHFIQVIILSCSGMRTRAPIRTHPLRRLSSFYLFLLALRCKSVISCGQPVDMYICTLDIGSLDVHVLLIASDVCCTRNQIRLISSAAPLAISWLVCTLTQINQVEACGP